MNADHDDRRLQEIGKAWSPRWRVWRSQDEFGMPKSWCATYQRSGAGLGRTLMEPTPEALEAALREAKTGPRPELEPSFEQIFSGARCDFTSCAPADGPVFEYLYVTVARRILRGIHATGLAPGQRLPPMARLAAAFAVSPSTVRHAVKLLEERGLAVCMHGRGVLVGRRVADLTTAAVAGGNGQLPDLLSLGAAVDAEPNAVDER